MGPLQRGLLELQLELDGGDPSAEAADRMIFEAAEAASRLSLELKDALRNDASEVALKRAMDKPENACLLLLLSGVSAGALG